MAGSIEKQNKSESNCIAVEEMNERYCTIVDCLI